MSGSVTDELIEALGELRVLFPDWRMGQLVANLTVAAGCTDDGAIWEVEDDRLVAAARRLIDANRGRAAASASSVAPTNDGGVMSSSTPAAPPP
jgi:hypothetical protein